MKQTDKQKWWYQEPWRMIQTNMRQIDMEDINAQSYVAELQKFHATVAMINVGGILASYPTKVDCHPVNPHLHGDSLLKIMDACHAAGIRVIARVDYSKIRRSVYEQHPEWAYRTPRGEIVDYNGNVHACICGGFQQEKAFEITKEIVSTFPIDGIFINMGGFNVKDYSYNYHGICHCNNCKKEFKKRFGLELPLKEDMSDPAYRKYCVFKRQITGEFSRRMAQLIHSINPDIAVEGVDFQRLESNTEYMRSPKWQYDSSSTVRGCQSLPTGLPCSNPSVDFIGYFYRHVAVSPALQEMRMWQTLANLGLLDYYIIGRLDNHQDRSGYEAIKGAFRFHRQHEDIYRKMRLKAKVLLIRQGGYAKSEEGCGWVRALTESHIPLHEAEVSMLCPEVDLSQYQALILADTATLGDECVELLDQYVANGGCLIVSGESGRYDDQGNERDTLPFDSLGKAPVKAIRKDMRSAMLTLTREDHAVFTKMRDTELVYFGDEFYFMDYPGTAKRSLKLIPPHMYGPPELCFYTQVTDIPGMVKLTYGKGTAIHIPWKPGQLYYHEGYDNTLWFMQGVLQETAGLETVEDSPFTQMVEVTTAQAEDGSQLIQLVNGTGHFGQSFMAPVPVYQIGLRIACPEKPSEEKTLNGGHAAFRWENGVLHIMLDRLDAFEAIYIK